MGSFVIGITLSMTQSDSIKWPLLYRHADMLMTVLGCYHRVIIKVKRMNTSQYRNNTETSYNIINNLQFLFQNYFLSYNYNN
jgi:hypothetical protein